MSTRREFLRHSLQSAALVSLAPQLPALLQSAAVQAADAKQTGERILVVLQLTGGNDGLNTVIPFRDDEYRKNRVTLGIPTGQVVKLNDDLGLHPALKSFAPLLEQNRFTVVQGVGYPQPDRSHFSSMDIWHTGARQSQRRLSGWLGRYVDDATAPQQLHPTALHLGSDKQPLALVAERTRVPSIQAVDGFQLQTGGDHQLRNIVEQLAAAPRDEGNDLLAFAQRSTQTALTSSQQVREALGRYQSATNYPGYGLAQRLKTVAQLIDAGLPTRVYYVTLDGFDTHADQAEAHAGLLTQLSQSVAAFCQDLAAHGHGERVLLMAFSEFGRRVKENASRGTDHGAAGPVLLAGGKLRGGVVGKHPSLTDLDDGDLKFHTDFRRVYATILDQWLGCHSREILGAEFPPLELFS